MLRLISALALLLALTAGADARRIVLSCQEGQSHSERIRGLPGRHGRSYDFCAFNTAVNDGGCLFVFCPDLGFDIGCNLNPHCLAVSTTCPPGDPEVMPEVFKVPVRGNKVVCGPQHTVVLKCRRPEARSALPPPLR